MRIEDYLKDPTWAPKIPEIYRLRMVDGSLISEIMQKNGVQSYVDLSSFKYL